MIGAIADDFTGGSDVAVAFRRAGLRTAIQFGLHGSSLSVAADVDALVIALKTRAVPAREAVVQSITAARQLRAAGADQLYFKYCSTFDSTPQGNIGPVADALLDLTGGPAVVVPSSPEHGRTQYLGHLFVADQLLSDSPLRNHPLTPMTDSRVPALLSGQTDRAVMLVAHPVVTAGHRAVRDAIEAARHADVPYIVIDAIDDDDLTTIGRACQALPLLTGAAGLAGGWARARTGRGATPPLPEPDPVGPGPAAVLAGSCSTRTLEQLDQVLRDHPGHRLDALTTPDPDDLAAAALQWYEQQDPAMAPVIYSSQPVEELRRVQDVLGTARASQILEGTLARVSRGLVERNVRRLVVAGGESSGAVVRALGVTGGIIGAEVAPGVPWIYSTTERGQPLALLLKSGNFGGPDLLDRAVTTCKEQP